MNFLHNNKLIAIILNAIVRCLINQYMIIKVSNTNLLYVCFTPSSPSGTKFRILAARTPPPSHPHPPPSLPPPKKKNSTSLKKPQNLIKQYKMKLTYRSYKYISTLIKVKSPQKI